MTLAMAREKLEIMALGVITLVVLLNSGFLASLSLNQAQAWQWMTDDLLLMGLIYTTFILLSIFCILFRKNSFIKRLFFSVLFLMTLHIFYNLFSLLTNPSVNHLGSVILLDAFIIWTSTMLTFSLWYWILDRGGPLSRSLKPRLNRQERHDFHFPQYGLQETGWQTWQPRLIDYVSLSFFVATNFSAADVIPLSKPAKILVMIEAGTSLVIIAMIITRAISLL